MESKTLSERLRESGTGGGAHGCVGVVHTLAHIIGRESQVRDECRKERCGTCASELLEALADEVEAELRGAFEAQEVPGLGMPSARSVLAAYAERVGMPMRDSEGIAEWLDRWYLPRPRFEDGEPVRFGDPCEPTDRRGSGEVGRICFTPNGFYFNSSKAAPEARKRHRHAYGERVARPAPKVLDADGAEIKVGDTVWRVSDGLKMKVRAVGAEAFEQCCEVLTLLPDDPDGAGALHYSGRELTHREPDSLERLRCDIDRWGDLYAPGSSDIAAACGEWAERLGAIMERDAR